MATKETETPLRHNEDGLPLYPTRYGMRTAKEAANELFEKSHARLQFLENVFATIQFDGCLHLNAVEQRRPESLLSRFTERNGADERSGCANHGLAAILEDVSTELGAFHAYPIGEELAPGKLAEGRPP
ncbi:MAG: hypothetical protein FWG75_01695 [Cystobacterineae bacterium]|nr:hypothetical protein [Cystobacterineae bacterium]